jgi:hypothetical protein
MRDGRTWKRVSRRKNGNIVSAEYVIAGDDAQFFQPGPGDNHCVKGIAMAHCQTVGRISMIGSDG